LPAALFTVAGTACGGSEPAGVDAPPALVALSISPDAAEVGVNTSAAFTATGLRDDGSTIGIPAVWSATGGAVDGAGHFHTPVAGSFLVIASDSSLADTARVEADAPSPPPDTATCAGRGAPTVTLSGTQTARLDDRTGLPAGAIIDAGPADWAQVDDYAVLIGGGDGWCWSGGRIEGFWDDQTPWADMHGRTAFEDYGGVGTVVEGLRLKNYGDGVTLRLTAERWTLRRSHLIHMRDDCIENDYERGGLVDDVFFEGCYNAFSAQPSEPQLGTFSGATNTWTIRNSLVWLEPMAQPYSGTPPNTSGFFKWDKSAYDSGPMLALSNNVFRADMVPADGTLCLAPPGKLVASTNNVIVWLGPGEYPCLPLPPGWTLTTDRRVWDDAVAAWTARHPG
jgi:hypothetical protein